MATNNTPLVALQPNYVFPVRWTVTGDSHGVWGKNSRTTCCGMDFADTPFNFMPGPITCDDCLTRLREQGWEV